MSKGKHSVNKNSKNGTKKKQLKLSVLLLSLLIVFICIFWFYFLVINWNKNHSNLETKPVEYEDSKIEISRYVEGLESLQILGVNIKSAETSSKISISLKNISNNSIEPCKLIFYMLDENGHKFFGTSLNVPLISPNEETTLKVFCTDDLSTAIDYEIYLETNV